MLRKRIKEMNLEKKKRTVKSNESDIKNGLKVE